MASLIENLIDVLEKENTEYEQLLDLSLNKTPVIVNGKVEELQEILTKEQLIIDKINLLEEKREESIKDISNVLNIPRDDMKVDQLIKMLSKQPKEQSMLEKVHGELKKTLHKLVKINDNNKVLLQESLEMIEFEVNLARNAVLAPETANYSKGAYNDAHGATGSFDAKQ